MFRTSSDRIVAVLAAALSLCTISCGSSDTSGTTTGPGAGAIAISLSSATGSVVVGGQAVVTATVTRSGFTGAVAVTVSGVPTGVTGSVGTLTTTGTTSSAPITISVGATVTPGTYSITVQASGSGVPNASATYVLTVSAAASSYSLSVSPTAATIAAGSSGTATVTINRVNFTGSVNLSVPNLPSGVTATFSPNNTTGTTSTVTITVASTVAAGLYPLTVGGVASGQPDQLAFLSVTVPATGSYAISVSPSTVTVVQGSSNTATVTVSRSGGFAGNVGLTATGNPSLLSATFSPTQVSGTSSTVTLTAGATQAPGTYTITIHGSASGFSSDQTTTLTVTVTSSGSGGSGNAVVNFAGCTAALQPVWFAYQDGTGAWTVVTGSNNVYQFNVTQSKVGFAYVTLTSASLTQIIVNYYAQSEITSAPLVFCPAPGTNTMTGTVAGLASGEAAHVGFDNQGAVTAYPSTSYSLSGLFTGSYDLVGWETGTLGASTTDKVIIRRGVSVDNTGTIPVLDFSTSEAQTPATGTITVANANGGSVTAEMTYYTSSCTSNGLLYFLLNPTTPFTAYGVPSTLQNAADFHDLIVGVTNGNNTLGVQDIFHTMGDRMETLPTPIATPAISVPSGSYKRLQAVYTLPTEYNGATTLTYYDSNNGHDVNITATAGYLGGSAVTLAMPDFSSLAGFQTAWAAASGASVNWIVQASGNNFTGASYCQEGGRVVSDVVSGMN
jgi:hypothetical protein